MEHLEDAEVSFSDSEELQRLTNRAKYENVANMLKHDDDLMEIHQRMVTSTNPSLGFTWKLHVDRNGVNR